MILIRFRKKEISVLLIVLERIYFYEITEIFWVNLQKQVQLDMSQIVTNINVPIADFEMLF